MGQTISSPFSNPKQTVIHNHYYNTSSPQSIPNNTINYSNGRSGSNSLSSQPQLIKQSITYPNGNKTNIQKGPHINQDYNKNRNQKQTNNQNKLMLNEMQDEQIQRLQKIIQQYEKNIQNAKQYGRKMKDYTKYDEFRKQSLQIYLNKLKQMKLQQKLISKDKICRKAIIGKISSGKSSLLNTLLGLQLQTGTGQTTLQPSLVYNKNNVVIIDTPGENEDFNTQQIQNIKLLSQVNQIYIVYPDSLKNAEHLVRVITSIKPKNTILIRTKCDMYGKKDKRTIEEQIQNDYKVLEMWGIFGVKIYATSAFEENGFQNNEVKNKLLEYPQIAELRKQF